jgi:Fe2+ transport system protein B
VVAIFLIGIGVVMLVVSLFWGRAILKRSRGFLMAGAEFRAPDLAETLFRVFMASLHFVCGSAIPAALAILGMTLIFAGVIGHLFF